MLQINDGHTLGLIVSGVTALVSLWTRVTVAELRNSIFREFASRRDFERLERRVHELEVENVR